MTDLSATAPGLDRGLPFEGDEEKKASLKIKKDTVFNMEDMMAPGNNDTFDFLNVKVAPIDQVAEDLPKESMTEGKCRMDINGEGVQWVYSYFVL